MDRQELVTLVAAQLLAADISSGRVISDSLYMWRGTDGKVVFNLPVIVKDAEDLVYEVNKRGNKNA
jgi:hypothetical protein